MSPVRLEKNAQMSADRIIAGVPLLMTYLRNEVDGHGPGREFAEGEITEMRKQLDLLESYIRRAKHVGLNS